MGFQTDLLIIHRRHPELRRATIEVKDLYHAIHVKANAAVLNVRHVRDNLFYIRAGHDTECTTQAVERAIREFDAAMNGGDHA